MWTGDRVLWLTERRKNANKTGDSAEGHCLKITKCPFIKCLIGVWCESVFWGVWG